jgi:hypothetical protein
MTFNRIHQDCFANMDGDGASGPTLRQLARSGAAPAPEQLSRPIEAR